MNQVIEMETANIAGPRKEGKSILYTMADTYGMEPKSFEATVRATCSPKGQNQRPLSHEEFAAFLLVAKQYDLNPIIKEIYAFPAKGGGIVPIVSVDGWINLVNSHPQCDGFDFEMEVSDKNQLVACACRIYRKDRSHPVLVTEYLAECYRDTDVWRKMPYRMLRHKALIQAARYAFGFAGIYDEDEAARIAEFSAKERRSEQANGSAGPKTLTPPLPPNVSSQSVSAQAEQPKPDIEKLEAQLKQAPNSEKLDEVWSMIEGIHEQGLLAPEQYRALEDVCQTLMREIEVA